MRTITGAYRCASAVKVLEIIGELPVGTELQRETSCEQSGELNKRFTS